MQIKFDIDEIVYVPVRVCEITINGRGCLPEYRVCPLGKTNEYAMTYLENKLFTEEDIIQTASNGGEIK